MDGTVQARVEALLAQRDRLATAVLSACGRRNLALALALRAELRQVDGMIALLRQDIGRSQ